jgi:predicted regulator of Ras-like GTPase activity (Roadblock/LC7/MglB family)
LNQAILEKVSAVAGVTGVALIEADGSCSADALQPPYEPVLLGEVAKSLRAAQECYYGIEGLVPAKTMAVRSSEGHLLVRNLDQRDIVVICTRSANLALVSVALNVAELKLSAQGRGSTSAAPPPIPSYASQPPHQPVSPASAQQPPAAPPMSWSPTSSGSSGGVGIKVMRHVRRTLEKYLGAQAQVVLEDELRQRGRTPATLDVDHFADVIRAAARQIPEPERRRQFIGDVLGDKKRRRL